MSKERYVVLVSTLYAEGENLKTIRGYVDALGSKDPQGFLLQTADRYAKSGDRIKQRQADTVRLLATALRQQEQGIEVPPVVQPAAALPSEAQPAVAAAAPTSPVAAAKGVVQVPQGDSARVRTEPKTAAPTIIQLSSGAKVDIIDVIRGQEVTAGENRWYKVKSNDSVGYVYYPLIAPAN